MLRYLTPSRTRNVSRFRFGLGHAKVLLERETQRYLTPSRTRCASRFRCGQASNSSTVRGQSSFSSRDSERSARTRPSVWQRGQ
jgi:hypothetical protein